MYCSSDVLGNGVKSLVRASTQDGCFACLPRLRDLRIVPPDEPGGPAGVDTTGLPGNLQTLEV